MFTSRLELFRTALRIRRTRRPLALAALAVTLTGFLLNVLSTALDPGSAAEVRHTSAQTFLVVGFLSLALCIRPYWIGPDTMRSALAFCAVAVILDRLLSTLYFGRSGVIDAFMATMGVPLTGFIRGDTMVVLMGLLVSILLAPASRLLSLFAAGVCAMLTLHQIMSNLYGLIGPGAGMPIFSLCGLILLNLAILPLQIRNEGTMAVFLDDPLGRAARGLLLASLFIPLLAGFALVQSKAGALEDWRDAAAMSVVILSFATVSLIATGRLRDALDRPGDALADAPAGEAPQPEEAPAGEASGPLDPPPGMAAIVLMELRPARKVGEMLRRSTNRRVMNGIRATIKARGDAPGFVSRSGDDEFLVVLENAAADEVKALFADVEQCLDVIQAEQGDRAEVTIAMGAALVDPVRDQEAFDLGLRRAAAALDDTIGADVRMRIFDADPAPAP